MSLLTYIYPRHFLIFHDLITSVVLPSHSQLSGATSFPVGPRGSFDQALDIFDD